MTRASTALATRRRPSRREELLAAAARLFAERGFARVTVDEIGAACGISGPALYHHFPSKESMLGEMLLAVSDHLLARGSEIARRASDPSGALRNLVDEHISFAVRSPELITVYARDIVHVPAGDATEIRRLQRRYVELWVDVLRAMVPELEPRRAKAAVHAVFGLLNSTPFTGSLPSSEMTALLRVLADAALDELVR